VPGEVLPMEIQIRGLIVEGIHGVLETERSSSQRFGIDVDVTGSIAAASSSDQLEDTINYADLVEVVAGVVGGAHSYFLLEALADASARAVLASDDRIATVALTVRKLDPPIPRPLESVGVRVELARPLP
jgi:dihydroneopterin aldolase